MQTNERLKLNTHLARAKLADMPATLKMAEWTQTIADFNELCAYCLQQPYEVLEHFIPVYLAGTHVKNCIPACKACNSKKRDLAGNELLALFGEAAITRIEQYLASRVELPAEVEADPPQAHPHSIIRWSTRSKHEIEVQGLPLEEKPTYAVEELFENLMCPLIAVAKQAHIDIKALSRLQYGERVQHGTAKKFLRIMSLAYGRKLTIKNVTGMSIMGTRKGGL